MSDNPFTPIPGAAPEAGAGEPSISAGQIAAAAAAAAVRGAPTPAAEQPLQSQEAQYVQPQATTPEDTPTLPNPLAVPTEVTPTAHFASEAYNQLLQLGIDLPVSPENVNPEFAAAYNVLAQTVLDTHTVAQERSVEAQVAQGRIQALSERLGTPEGQERLILSLALSNPEGFQQAMDKVGRVQTDADYAEAVRIRLEGEAMKEQAVRMNTARESATMQSKGQQVEGRTERLATQLGVDVGLAKQIVASKILQNEAVTGVRDITFAEVDGALQQLAKATNATPVLTPGAYQAQAQAPQAPAAAAGQTPVAPEQQQQMLTPTRGSQTTPNSDAMDVLRAAVRNSAMNVGKSGL